jgi:hypothetical protein
MTNNSIDKQLEFGLILRDIKLLQPSIIDDGWQEIHLSYVFIVSQACDLEQYQKNPQKHNNYLPNILILPLYDFNEFCNGRHINHNNLEGAQIYNNEKSKEKLKKNQDNRFHYISDRYFINKNDGIELLADFKHYYSTTFDWLDKQFKYDSYVNYFGKVKDLFKEQISQRFCNYLSRIGLPDK